MRKLPWIAWIALLSLFDFHLLLAHYQPEALTTISYNPNTKSTEIVHRLHAHDAERILEELPDGMDTDIDSVEGKARIALYIEERFELTEQNGKKLTNIKLIGAELEGDTLYAYQEFTDALNPSFRIRNDILRDILPNQVNTVNILTKAGVRTLVFSGKDKWKTVHNIEAFF